MIVCWIHLCIIICKMVHGHNKKDWGSSPKGEKCCILTDQVLLGYVFCQIELLFLFYRGSHVTGEKVLYGWVQNWKVFINMLYCMMRQSCICTDRVSLIVNVSEKMSSTLKIFIQVALHQWYESRLQEVGLKVHESLLNAVRLRSSFNLQI